MFGNLKEYIALELNAPNRLTTARQQVMSPPPLHLQLELARGAINPLTAQGRDLHIAPQNLVELGVVATPPADQNGLGMTPSAASAELTRLKSMFVLLPDGLRRDRALLALLLGCAFAGAARRGWMIALQVREERRQRLCRTQQGVK